MVLKKKMKKRHEDIEMFISIARGIILGFLCIGMIAFLTYIFKLVVNKLDLWRENSISLLGTYNGFFGVITFIILSFYALIDPIKKVIKKIKK